VHTEALAGRGETCRWMSAAAGASGDRVLASNYLCPRLVIYSSVSLKLRLTADRGCGDSADLLLHGARPCLIDIKAVGRFVIVNDPPAVISTRNITRSVTRPPAKLSSAKDFFLAGFKTCSADADIARHESC